MTKIRIPTTQFGYLEFEFEGTPEQAIAEHNRIIKLYNGEFGLEDKEFNKALDEYLSTGTLKEGTELYQRMSLGQQECFQQIKKSLGRIKSKLK